MSTFLPFLFVACSLAARTSIGKVESALEALDDDTEINSSFLLPMQNAMLAARTSIGKVESALEALNDDTEINSSFLQSMQNATNIHRWNMDVVFIRHGKSYWNAHEKTGWLAAQAMKLAKKSGKNFITNKIKNEVEVFKDAPLVQQGIEEAIHLQEFVHFDYQTKFGTDATLLEKLEKSGLHPFIDPTKEAGGSLPTVQLAGSGLSRAYDTLILATARLLPHVTSKVHVVPSLMEFGNIDTLRKRETPDNALVYKEDSIFREANYADAFPFWGQYYATLQKPNTSKLDRAEVQTRYERYHSSTCDHHQLDDLFKYLAFEARQGIGGKDKKLLIAGTHSNLIRCMPGSIDPNSATKKATFPVKWPMGSHKVDSTMVELKQNGKSYQASLHTEKYNLGKDRLPNGALLTFGVHITSGDTQENCDRVSGRRFAVIPNEMVCVQFDRPQVTEFKAPTSTEAKAELARFEALAKLPEYQTEMGIERSKNGSGALLAVT